MSIELELEYDPHIFSYPNKDQIIVIEMFNSKIMRFSNGCPCIWGKLNDWYSSIGETRLIYSLRLYCNI